MNKLTPILPGNKDLSRRSPKDEAGFTLVEVLFAILIFVIAALAAADLTRGSVRATREGKDISVATWLLQNVMTELETKLETEGFDKGCDKKKEGKFDPPNDRFVWTAYCNDIDFKLSSSAAKILAKEDSKDDKPSTEDMIQKIILKSAGDYLTKSIRELHVEIKWKMGSIEKTIDATTHVAVYNLPFTVSGIPDLGGTK